MVDFLYLIEKFLIFFKNDKTILEQDPMNKLVKKKN